MNLFTGDSIAQAVLVLSLVIAIGISLSKIKIAGISFGITWILFAGIAFGHFGLKINGEVLHFVKEFGLILFVYSIGLQVGPGFFSSFKKGGVKMNIVASSVVLTGVLVTYVIYSLTSLPISTMVGIMSGAITNTPGLGAAQQTFTEINGVSDPSIAMGYAVAYPLGVIGIILSLMAIRFFFNISVERERTKMKEGAKEDPNETIKISVLLNNPALFSKRIDEVKTLIDKSFIISRICTYDNMVKIVGASTVLEEGYRLLVILQKGDRDSVVAFLGTEIDMKEADWETSDKDVVSKRILVTRETVNGKSLSDLKFGRAFAITVTRVNRSGVDLVATPGLKLQIGDKLTVVGSPSGVESAAQLIGNALHRLREPNLISIFLGIAVGILFGSIPFFIPGVPQPVKLGLAGGPLIIAILMSKFGPRYKLVTYTTVSANLMLREIGIALFLACVGLGAGGGFIDTIVNKGGAIWILYGVLITVLPLIIVGVVSYKYFKINYFTLMGLLAGSCTDPPALAFANSSAGNDMPAVAYATVYPLTMFLRVLMAQLMILLG